MNVLALDAATPLAAVALARSDGWLREAYDERPKHAQALLSLAAALLDEGGVSWVDVDCLAVGVGPGSFTGLRIALATARGLAHARGAGLVGVSTLRALAEPVPVERTALAVIDARRGEAFAAVYAAGEELVAPCVCTPAQLEALARRGGPRALAVGDGALRFRELLERAGVEVAPAPSALHRVGGGAICRLAASGSSTEAVPVYLRAPDAELALAAKTT